MVPRGFDPQKCYDTPVYDGHFSWKRETEYFFRSFLQGYLGREKIDSAALDEFKEIACGWIRKSHVFSFTGTFNRVILWFYRKVSDLLFSGRPTGSAPIRPGLPLD